MSDLRSLRARPDLRRLRDEAKARRRARRVPTLALAQLAIAREHGFASWPRLKAHVEALTLGAGERADGARALRLLVRPAPGARAARRRSGPRSSRPRVRVRDRRGRRGGASARGAPELAQPAGAAVRARAAPLRVLLATAARRPRARAGDPRARCALLLDAGADPNASFDHEGWLQVPLYGAAGIANDAELTRMLIDAGADPNDAASRRRSARRSTTRSSSPTRRAPRCSSTPGPTASRRRLLPRPRAELPRSGDGRDAVRRAGLAPRREPAPGRVPPGARRARSGRCSTLARRSTSADDDGLTPLRLATRWGERELAALLVERGADRVAVRDEDRALGAFLVG